MKLHQTSLGILLFLLGVIAATAEIQLNTIARGWVYSSTVNPDAVDMANDNYATGFDIGLESEYRSFFVFDLSSLNTTVTEARLKLFQPIDGYHGGVSEELNFYDVNPASAQALVSGHIEFPGLFDDLGGGWSFGSYTITPAQSGSFIDFLMPKDFVDLINNSHGIVAIGGRLTSSSTYDTEYVFGYTGWNAQPADGHTYMVLSPNCAIPEPATYGCFGALVVVSLVCSRSLRQTRATAK